ncbi:MAG: hypothetical protein KC420_00650 [Myxococcales bacterium]|nr:hypothetical protein [Myxococcales bacterium]MCB9570146.1 hypothetical protein [Myxococcales bacterium]MCB9705187.1 hypothetical protein [Myxococcales bacterium]
MDEIINGLITKVGLDKETAEKVIAFLKEHADDLPGLLAKSGLQDKITSKLPGGLGGLFGGG